MDDQTALHLASSGGTAEIVQLLIQHGADVSTQNKSLDTPLHLALTRVSAKRICPPIQHRADVNGQISYRDLSEGKFECVRLLVQHGVDVNAVGKDSKTALHLASLEGCAEILQLLIQHGADVNIQDKNLNTPMHLALTRVSARSM